ncbi:MAG TPA: PqiC family protein [Alphaproteobacteria bacterium]|nr:PqiC family protein [Alphaproteobacteria bacterium]
MKDRTVRRSLLSLAAFGALALALAGCGTTLPPAHLYVLNPMPGAAAPSTPVKATGVRVIGVAPTSVPEYLERPEIVVRSGANELTALSGDRWAERLSVNISRVLTLNLAALLPQDTISLIPTAFGQPLDYEVRLVLTEFELDRSGDATLVGHWAIADARDSKLLETGNLSLRAHAASGDLPAEVAAMNDNIAAASRAIGAALARIEATAPPPSARK